MARFFINPENRKDDWAEIIGPDVKHIAKVLRLKAGDQVTLLDGNGWQYLSEIYTLEKEKVTCKIIEKSQAQGESPVNITLVQGLPKGDKMELVIQKGTELGINTFIPLICKRSVVKIEGQKEEKRQERWQRVALEAAKQCRRPLVPKVQKPLKWAELFQILKKDSLLLMPFETENLGTLKTVLSANKNCRDIVIIIGPEGGFDPEEVDNARAAGIQTVSLGPRILRTETAGLTMASILLYLYGDLG